MLKLQTVVQDLRGGKVHTIFDESGRAVGEFGKTLMHGAWYIRAFEAGATVRQEFARITVAAKPSQHATVKKAALHFVELSIAAQAR